MQIESYFELLGEIDNVSYENISAFQDKKIKELAKFCISKEFYKTSFPELLDLAENGLESLSKQKILSSQFLSENSPPKNLNMVFNSRNSGVVLASGGSSGTRKTIFHDWDFYRHVMKMGARGLLHRLGKQPQKVANCFLPGSLWGGFLFGNGVAEELGSQLFALGRPSNSELAKYISEYKIDCFFSSPSFAYSFFLDENIDIKLLSSITDFCYVGETPIDNLIRKIEEKLPQMKLHSLAYTANETGVIGYQCPLQKGSVHHVHEDSILLEIVDTHTGQHVKDGLVGDILVTTLQTHGTPLIRYRIGDLGRYLGRNCSCGSNTMVIDLIGRSATSFKICGTIISFEYIQKILLPFGKITESDFQLKLENISGKSKFTVFLNRFATSGTEKLIKELIEHDSLFMEILAEQQSAGFDIHLIEPNLFKTSNKTGKKLLFYNEGEH